MRIVEDKHNRPLYLFPTGIEKGEAPAFDLWTNAGHFYCLGLETNEEISRPFLATLDLWASESLLAREKLQTWLWRSFDLFLETGAERVGGGPSISRRLRGLATSLEDRGPLRTIIPGGRETPGRLLRMVLEPDIAMLGRIVRSRVHAGTLAGIIRGLMAHNQPDCPELLFDIRLEADRPVFQKTQHAESDLAFLSRLAEEYGIAWFCDWKADRPAWVFTDTPGGLDGPVSILRTLDNSGERLPPRWAPTGAADLPPDRVHEASTVYQGHSGRFQGCSLDYYKGERAESDQVTAENRAADLKGISPYPLSRGKVTLGDVAGCGDTDWVWNEELAAWKEEQQHRVRLEALREASSAVRGRLAGSLGSPMPGALVRLEGEGNGNRILVAACRLRASHHPRAEALGPSGVADWGSSVFTKRLEAETRPAECGYVPPRRTTVPKVHGIRTARVVGLPDSQDRQPAVGRYGSVLVRMDWLQDGVDNPNQRWVRVCQPWAGHQFGTLFWPRVGGEVALAFEGGDPDRPIVVGGLYSLWNLPPESYDGVPQGWLSGIVSRPKPGDGITDEMFNFVKIYDDTNCQVLVHSATSNFDVSSGNSFKVCRGGSVQVSGSLL